MPSVARRLLKTISRLASMVAATLTVAGCGPAQVLNTLIPDDGYRIERDLTYGDAARQRLDVYVPQGLEAPVEVVVFFYGGGWDSGSKASYRFVGQALASTGFVAVIPDYRIYPEVRFPAFVEDGAQAVAWVQDNITRLGGDPERIHLMGHSAGAHIAALLALDHGYLKDAGVDRSAIKSLVGLAGPYDFLPLTDPELQQIFAVDDLQATQPITFVDGRAPPTLLLHGSDDRTVWPKNSQHLASALEAAGVPVTLKIYEQLGHPGLVASLAAPLRWLAPTLDDVSAFIETTAPPFGPGTPAT